jgi:hypothetical protein
MEHQHSIPWHRLLRQVEFRKDRHLVWIDVFLDHRRALRRNPYASPRPRWVERFPFRAHSCVIEGRMRNLPNSHLRRRNPLQIPIERFVACRSGRHSMMMLRVARACLPLNRLWSSGH